MENIYVWCKYLLVYGRKRKILKYFRSEYLGDHTFSVQKFIRVINIQMVELRLWLTSTIDVYYMCAERRVSDKIFANLGPKLLE